MEEALKAIYQTPKLLPEQVAGQIKELIRNSKWEAGKKLPNEFEMARQLSVGRGTIREAVKLLMAQNILEIRRGCGTFVCERPGVVDDPLGLSFMIDKQKLALDMCEVRLMIEPQIAAKAAVNGTSKDVELLRELCQRVEEQIYAEEDHAQADIAFHEALAACTGNQVMRQLVPIIQNSIMLFIDVTKAGLKHYTIGEHRMLVDAVEAHNAQKAEEIMTKHIRQNQENINHLIDEEKRKGKQNVEKSGT